MTGTVREFCFRKPVGTPDVRLTHHRWQGGWVWGSGCASTLEIF